MVSKALVQPGIRRVRRHRSRATAKLNATIEILIQSVSLLPCPVLDFSFLECQMVCPFFRLDSCCQARRRLNRLLLVLLRIAFSLLETHRLIASSSTSSLCLSFTHESFSKSPAGVRRVFDPRIKLAWDHHHTPLFSQQAAFFLAFLFDVKIFTSQSYDGFVKGNGLFLYGTTKTEWYFLKGASYEIFTPWYLTEGIEMWEMEGFFPLRQACKIP